MNEYVRFVLDAPLHAGRAWQALAVLQPRIEELPGGIRLPEWMAPSAALGALLSLLILGGIAIGSLAVAVTALILVALILDQVFGITVEAR